MFPLSSCDCLTWDRCMNFSWTPRLSLQGGDKNALTPNFVTYSRNSCTATAAILHNVVANVPHRPARLHPDVLVFLCARARVCSCGSNSLRTNSKPEQRPQVHPNGSSTFAHIANIPEEPREDHLRGHALIHTHFPGQVEGVPAVYIKLCQGRKRSNFRMCF